MIINCSWTDKKYDKVLKMFINTHLEQKPWNVHEYTLKSKALEMFLKRFYDQTLQGCKFKPCMIFIKKR